MIRLYFSKVTDGHKQLHLTGPGFTQAVLLVWQNAVMFKMLHDTTMHDMFHYFATYRGEGDWSVVCWVCLSPILKTSTMWTFFQSSGTTPWPNEAWKISCSTPADSSAVILSRWLGMSSGSMAECDFWVAWVNSGVGLVGLIGLSTLRVGLKLMPIKQPTNLQDYPGEKCIPICCSHISHDH